MTYAITKTTLLSVIKLRELRVAKNEWPGFCNDFAPVQFQNGGEPILKVLPMKPLGQWLQRLPLRKDLDELGIEFTERGTKLLSGGSEAHFYDAIGANETPEIKLNAPTLAAPFVLADFVDPTIELKALKLVLADRRRREIVSNKLDKTRSELNKTSRHAKSGVAHWKYQQQIIRRTPFKFAVIAARRKLNARRLVTRTLAQFVDNPRYVCGWWIGKRKPFRTPVFLRHSRWLQEIIGYGLDYRTKLKTWQEYEPPVRTASSRFSWRKKPKTKGDKLSQAKRDAESCLLGATRAALEEDLGARGLHDASAIAHRVDLSSPYYKARKELKQWSAKRKQLAAAFNEAWSNYRQAREQADKLLKKPESA